MIWLVSVLTFVSGIYLIYAIVKPERF
ncbi:MAG: potassium-transporting ATPase subunit F [Bacteriovoracia bacterium]